MIRGISLPESNVKPDRCKKDLSCYKFEMPKTIEQWLLFKYIDGEFTPLSKPLKSKQLAEKARSKYSKREQKTIGVGVVRIKS